MAKFINKVDISDSLIERPIGFSVRGRHFSVYHPSLGKIHLLSRLLATIGFGEDARVRNIYGECLRAANERRSECLRILAYSTIPGKDCLDEVIVKKRLAQLRSIDGKDLATLLFTILSLDKSDAIMDHFGIGAEYERLSKAIRAKGKDKGAFDFGGKTIWGTLIDSACERYGWSFDYVLWGISYSNLRLLQSDHIKTIFLTEEERRNAHLSNDSVVVNADDKKSLEDFIKTQSWR